MNLRIRPFNAEDQSAARRVVLQGLGEHFGVIDESLNPDLEDIQTSFIAAGHEFQVAEYDGNIVGTAGLRFEPGRARIIRMSVDKKYRKKGIATALLKRCIEVAKARGYAEIFALTEPHWPDAVGLYTSLGFKPYDRDEIDIHLRLQF
jgi:N-acetylglutamate synthase-like GNAT family acetyltransferase